MDTPYRNWIAAPRVQTGNPARHCHSRRILSKAKTPSRALRLRDMGHRAGNGKSTNRIPGRG
jgi:hypothetical protein